MADDLKYELIVAHDDARAIGYQNKLPWSIPSEFKYFIRMSSTPKDPNRKCVAVMGSKSWESLPPSARPFPNCINIVLSSKMEQPEGMEDVYVCRSWEAMETLLRSEEMAARRDRIWIHGGNAIYTLSMESPHFHRLYKTQVSGTYPADAFFPEVPFKLKKVVDPDAPQGIIEDSGYMYEVQVFEKADDDQ